MFGAALAEQALGGAAGGGGFSSSSSASAGPTRTGDLNIGAGGNKLSDVVPWIAVALVGIAIAKRWSK